MKKNLFKYIAYFILILSCILLNLSMKKSEEEVSQVKSSFSDSIYKEVVKIERAKVIEMANMFLKVKPVTITSYSCSRSAGGPHDFFSEGPYWWPDPANPNGPYIRKDGFRNPDLFKEHDNALIRFSDIVCSEALAYRLTGDEKYAEAAIKHLKSWFIDTSTRMNPNMLYAQAVNGICTGRGIGIIDANPLIYIAQSVKILEKSPLASSSEIIEVKEWFSQFLKWMTTHQYGIDEITAKNNHATWCLVQVATYSGLVGDAEKLNDCRRRFREIIIPEQMAADGSFPLELERTKPFSYSLFNLDAMTLAAWILSDNSSDLFNYSLPDGRGLKRGLEFMLPYIKDIRKWPYAKDVSNWNEQPGQRIFMLFASIKQEDRALFAMWKTLGEKDYARDNTLSIPTKNPLLWIKLN